MNVDTDEFLKSLKSLQVSPCECSAKNPDSDYPNQHTKACPRFQTMHCWCPPATGPNQPHLSSCTQYKRPLPGNTIDKIYRLDHSHGLYTHQHKLSQSQIQLLTHTQAQTVNAQAKVDTSDAAVNLKEKLAVYNELDVAGLKV
jgi:hypothetical protein